MGDDLPDRGCVEASAGGRRRVLQHDRDRGGLTDPAVVLDQSRDVAG